MDTVREIVHLDNGERLEGFARVSNSNKLNSGECGTSDRDSSEPITSQHVSIGLRQDYGP